MCIIYDTPPAPNCHRKLHSRKAIQQLGASFIRDNSGLLSWFIWVSYFQRKPCQGSNVAQPSSFGNETRDKTVAEGGLQCLGDVRPSV